jgi:hypothetical protein
LSFLLDLFDFVLVFLLLLFLLFLLLLPRLFGLLLFGVAFGVDFLGYGDPFEFVFVEVMSVEVSKESL